MLLEPMLAKTTMGPFTKKYLPHYLQAPTFFGKQYSPKSSRGIEQKLMVSARSFDRSISSESQTSPNWGTKTGNRPMQTVTIFFIRINEKDNKDFEGLSST